jgi:UDP-N-acetylmuramoylalanine--D-glutamate ligase
MELAARFVDAPIIAVTGTNGKTTVTSFLGQCLKMRAMMFLWGATSAPP